MSEHPEDIDKEAAELFKKEDDRVVNDLHEAWKLDRALKLMDGYLKSGFLTTDMPLIDALEKLEEKKFEFLGIEPDEELEA